MNTAITSTRKQPQQKRAQQRRQQILDVSADILIEQGLERFNTALVTERLGVSIGSLYRYFPNKQSILYTLADQWLEANRQVFLRIAEWDLSQMSLADYASKTVDQFAELYQSEHKLTEILAVIIEIPELAELNDNHDKFITREIAKQLRSLGIEGTKSELDRLGYLIITQVHYSLVVMLKQSPRLAKRSLDDAKDMFLVLLEKYQS